jgi:hypothetical protein
MIERVDHPAAPAAVDAMLRVYEGDPAEFGARAPHATV